MVDKALLPQDPTTSPASLHVALLSIGLLRGLHISSHRRWLAKLSFGLSVFGFYEVEQEGSSCQQTLSVWLNESFAASRYVTLRYINETELDEQDTQAGPVYFKQFYKTWKAHQMMEFHEQSTGQRFDHVLRTRVDSSGKLPAGWLAALQDRLTSFGPNAALVQNDFSWLAGRVAAGRLARAWKVIADCGPMVSSAMPWRLRPRHCPPASNVFADVNYCAMARSTWALNPECSNFMGAIRWPMELLVELRADSWNPQKYAETFGRACRRQNESGWPLAPGNSSLQTHTLFEDLDSSNPNAGIGMGDPEAVWGLIFLSNHMPLGGVEMICLADYDAGPTSLVGNHSSRRSSDKTSRCL